MSTSYQLRKNLLVEARTELQRVLHIGSIVQIIVLNTSTDTCGNLVRTVKLLAPIVNTTGEASTTDITVYAHRVLQTRRHTRLVQNKTRSCGLSTHASDMKALVQMLSYEVFGLYDQLNYNEIH